MVLEGSATSATRGPKIGMVARDQILKWTLLLFWEPGDELTIGKIPDSVLTAALLGVNTKVRKEPNLRAKIELHFDTIIVEIG